MVYDIVTVIIVNHHVTKVNNVLVKMCECYVSAIMDSKKIYVTDLSFNNLTTGKIPSYWMCSCSGFICS